MKTANLPATLLETAVHSGQELGWRKEQFPSILERATTEGFACIGGQFQWVFPDGACEAYWLNADASPRQPNETWSKFVARSQQEVLEAFSCILSTVSFDVKLNDSST